MCCAFLTCVADHAQLLSIAPIQQPSMGMSMNEYDFRSWVALGKRALAREVILHETTCIPSCLAKRLRAISPRAKSCRAHETLKPQSDLMAINANTTRKPCIHECLQNVLCSGNIRQPDRAPLPVGHSSLKLPALFHKGAMLLP